MQNDKFFKRLVTVGSIAGILIAVNIGFLRDVSVGGASFWESLTNPLVGKPSINDNSGTKTPAQSYQPVGDEESAVIGVVDKASPSVVSIVATKDISIVEGGQYSPFCNDPFFRQFLGGQCNQSSTPPSQHTETQEVAAGTGFFVSSDGYILTNKHVIDIDQADFTIVTNDGKKYPAKIVAKDPAQDLALMKVDGNFHALTLGDSDNLQVGQTVIAIGNALGQFTNSVSKGVVSGLARSITTSGDDGSSEQLSAVIQTDAAINPGNSGGPLLNLKGEVIGVNSAVAEDAQNVGFALPINQAKRDISQVKNSGKISFPFLGVRYVLVNTNLEKEKNLAVDYGAIVSRGQNGADVAVSPGSPAEKAGLRENDIILEIDGKKITTSNDLSAYIQTHKVGDMVTLKVLSGDKERSVKVLLGERK